MRGAVLLLAAIAPLACSRKQASPPAESTYVPADRCRACHAQIAESYQHVAMAQSLYRPTTANVIEDYRKENYFYHAASGRHYRMTERDGRFYQRRYQTDGRGREINALEVEISYIIGSGRHARSYLHQSVSGELTELPVTWYSQERRWGISPGYDQASHPDFTRVIDHNCLFCHNAYPTLPAGTDRYGMRPRFPERLPQGIDCQRCHGPGSRHIELAASGRSSVEAVRGAVVNPAKLPLELQLDVCRQCHLEITSAKLPQAVARFGRPVYSFRPGERLDDSLIHFDHPAGAGYDDKFEIVSTAYRLRKSQCFLKSGRLTCITCHNPHRTPQGAAATTQFRAACVGCHTRSIAAPHPDMASSDCVACHMPKRRTEDAVHIVMTDHLIRRRKVDRDLLAPLREKNEKYRGAVVFYGPPQLSEQERDLYMGIALAKDGADRAKGIALMEQGIAVAGAKAPVEALIELADAYAAEGNPRSAVEKYRKALANDPRLAVVRYDLGRELAELGDLAGARAEFEQAIRNDPELPEAYNNLGTVLAQLGEPGKAAEAYRNAIRSRPVYPEAHNNLGRLHADQGRTAEALAEADEALRCDPAFAPAFNTQGIVHATLGRLELAIAAFQQALRVEPGFADAHYNLGRALHAQGKTQPAMAEYRRAIQLDPKLAAAHLSLGVAFGEIGKLDDARVEFQEALRLRPGYPDAQRNLRLLDEMKSLR